MPSVTSSSGRIYHLGRNPRRDRPERWRHELIPFRAPAPGQRSLSAYRTPNPFDQGQEGSCTANAFVLLEYMAAKISGTNPQILSRMLAYYLSRNQPDNQTFPQDSGASIEDPFTATQSNGGLCTDTVWPYDANPSETPPAAVAGAQKYTWIASGQPISPSNLVPGIRTALDNRQPVSIGFMVSQAMINDSEQTGVMLAKDANNFEGGHDVVIWGECLANASAGLPTGGFAAQNSWGAYSPVSISTLHPDARPGDVILPFEIFDGRTVEDADAAVPMTAPATLTVQVTAPSTATVGQPCAWSAQITGLPNGSVPAFAWAFSDGESASGQNATATPQNAGTLTGTCTVTVATTGASASGSGSVSVAGSQPQPQPPTPPTPTNQQAQIDAAIAGTIAIMKGYAIKYPANAKIYNYAAYLAGYIQQYDVDALFSSSAMRRVTEAYRHSGR